MNRIYSQKNGNINEQDRLAIAQLLVKAGYAVRLGKEKPGQKPNSQYVHYVEYTGDGEAAGKQNA